MESGYDEESKDERRCSIIRSQSHSHQISPGLSALDINQFGEKIVYQCITFGIGPSNVTTCALTNKQTKTEDLCH